MLWGEGGRNEIKESERGLKALHREAYCVGGKKSNPGVRLGGKVEVSSTKNNGTV